MNRRPAAGLASGLLAALLLIVAATAAPPRPPCEVFVEGESCTDHDFTTIGRDAAFAPCYGSAILQLQTTRPAPAGGYHARYRLPVGAAGWYRILLAATRPQAGAEGLSPFRLQVGDNREFDLAGVPATPPYGPGGIFGWIDAGRYRLTAGTITLTVRCDQRRRSDQAYLCYLDAIALHRVAEPVAEAHWLAAGDLIGTCRLAARPALPVLYVAAEGRCQVRVNGLECPASQTTSRWRLFDLRGRLTAGRNHVRLTTAGPVLARLTALAGQRRQTLLATGPTWTNGDRPATVLGPETMPPHGDMSVIPEPVVRVGPTPIPFKTGNLSVELIKAAARHEPLPEPRDRPEFDRWHDLASITTVEDYLCWLPLEPERDHFRWEYYERNAAELEARGMRYAVYPWLHFAPAWAMASEFWAPLLDLKSGKATFAPSIWSPRTLALFDRFYGQLRERMGDRVKEIFVSMVADYGEVGYPIGMADWVVPAPYKGADYWVGDPLARADFRERMVARYGPPAQLNHRWGTTFTRVGDIDYPPACATEGPAFGELQALPPGQRAQARRRWLDFIEWYLDAMVEFAGQAVATSRRHFPRTPHEVKIGFGSERVMFGADYTHYLARSKPDGYTVRSTHGKLPPYYYRRFSTAAKHYGVPLVTEPPSKVDRDEEVERIFKDATSGTSEYFDYPDNFLGATDLFARYAQYLEGRHSLTEVAFFMPTTDHRLRRAQHLPQRLVDACAASRELFDWDVVDERLIADGALSHYRVLLWPEGTVVEAAQLEQIRTWVAKGGVIVAADRGDVETVEGDTALSRELFGGRGSQPGYADLCPVAGQPVDAWRLDVGGPGDETALVGDWHRPESGHWEWGGEPNAVTKRWTGADSGVLLPVDPTAEYELAVTVALHPKRYQARHEVWVNGVRLGALAPQRQSVFRARIGPAVWQGRNPSELRFKVEAWRPAEIDGSTDVRVLGLAVDAVKLWRAGVLEPAIAPAPQLRRTVNREALARCVHRVGRGATVRLPADLPNAAALADLAQAVLAQPPAGVAGQPLVPDFGATRDGVWVALLPNRILLYNSARSPCSRTLTLEPAVLARLGARAPAGARQVRVTLPPIALASVELPGGEVVVP